MDEPDNNFSIDKFLHDITQAIYPGGDIIDMGCSEDKIDEMATNAHTIYPGKVRRIVKDWQWWDITIPDHLKLPPPLLPSILYADYVLEDESLAFRRGDWVRTTFLIKIHNNCIFETQNTMYILVGKGTRKTVDLKTVGAIF